MLYRFKIQAKNFNGWGTQSDVGGFFACVTPSDLDTPSIIETSSNTMTLEWTEPLDDGGCPIIGYALYRDDGITGEPSIEINTDNDLTIRN